MREPASVSPTARPAGFARCVVGRVRRLAEAACACAVATLIATTTAHATGTAVNGPIIEPEGTSAGGCHIVSRAPDGSNPTELLSTCPNASFDEDGNVTAETVYGGTSGIEIVVDGKVTRSITVANLPAGDGYAGPQLSPDGHWVGFYLIPSDPSDDASLYIAPTDGSSPAREVVADANPSVLEWTPDSKRIVTFVPRENTETTFEELVSIDAASGVVTDLSTAANIAPTDFASWNSESFTVADISPDGARALIEATRDPNCCDLDTRLWEIKLGAGTATRVSNSEYDLVEYNDGDSGVAAAQYSPDGTKIAIHVLKGSAVDSKSPLVGEYLVLHPLHATDPTLDHVVPIQPFVSPVNGYMFWEPTNSVSIDSPIAGAIVDADAAEHAAAGDPAGVVKATITGPDFATWCYTVGPVSPPPASLCKTPLTGTSPHHVTIPYSRIVDSLKQGPNTITVYAVTTSQHVVSTTRTFQWHLPPIIFVPGFGGSEIKCATGEVLFPQLATQYWIDFKHMRLDNDGFSPYPDGDSCTQSATAAGLVRSVAIGSLTIDIYGAGEDWLKSLSDPANGRPEYTYYYDWRKSPSYNVDGLNQMVDMARGAAHVDKVVLVGHSMGGLVIRTFLANPAYAAKVTRAITLGTPYWGAPKSIFPIEEGHESPDIGAYQIDPFAKSADFQRFAATSSGLDSLLPGDNYPGPWLGVQGSGGLSWIAQAQLATFLETNFGASTSLINSARALHDQIDGFPTTAVDYRALVSGGTPTITKVILTKGIFGWSELSMDYGDGDGTVPLTSQKQQANLGVDHVLGSQVPIYVQCFVGHMAETEDPGIQARLQAWISEGKPIPTNGSAGCTASGDELNIPDPSGGDTSGDVTTALAPQTPGALTLAQAQIRGLVQVLTFPDHEIVVANSHDPVDLELPPGVHDLTVTPLSGSVRGPAQRYNSSGAISSVSVSGVTAQPTAGGTVLNPIHGVPPAPRTVALVRIRGGRAVLSDHATGGAPYVRVGSRAPRLWRHPITLPRTRIGTVAFAAVNAFGTSEPEHFIRATGAVRSRRGIIVTVVCSRGEQGRCVGTLRDGRARVAYSLAPGHKRRVTLRRARHRTISVLDHATLIEELTAG